MHSAILTYHSLDGSGSVVSTPADLFRRQMQSLAGRGIPVAPLEEVARGREAVALTFDDGYANFSESALPVLEELGLPATVFVVSGLCGQWADWHVRSGIPRQRLMDWVVLRSLPSRLISLGSHTVSHPNLTRLTSERLAAELRDSRSEIEQRSGRAVTAVAYPYGSVNESVRAAAQTEYGLAAGTRLRYAGAASDVMDLPRVDSYYLRRLSVFDKITAGRGSQYLGVRRFLRELRSAVRSDS